jgi:hypothetical protein
MQAFFIDETLCHNCFCLFGCVSLQKLASEQDVCFCCYQLKSTAMSTHGNVFCKITFELINLSLSGEKIVKNFSSRVVSAGGNKTKKFESF